MIQFYCKRLISYSTGWLLCPCKVWLRLYLHAAVRVYEDWQWIFFHLTNQFLAWVHAGPQMIYTNLSMQYRYDYLHFDWPPDGKLCLLLVVTSGKPGRPAQTSNQLLRFLTCLMRHLKIVNSCVMRYLSFYPFRFLLSLYAEEEVALPCYVSLPTSLQNILSLL